MDIWEANSVATALTPHTCSKSGVYKCTGKECDRGDAAVCDKNGCSFNTYANGVKNFYGKGSQFAVDTSKPFTVVTQFPADSSGKLQSFKRLYVQNGKVIPQATAAVSGPPAQNFINEDYCQKTGAKDYLSLGGTKAMGESLSRGMVLAISIWWDDSGGMTWLDSGNAGPCNKTEGLPDTIKKVQPDPSVVFSNIKWGEIDSTYSGAPKSRLMM